MLPLLYQQHHHYTVELGETHQALSKLYKKLAKVERTLAEREERELSRSDKKKRQYTRALSKRAVTNLESKQASLHDHLRQCNDLIASFEQGTYYNSPITPWTSQMPPSPFLFTPYSPISTMSPWPVSLPNSSNAGRSSETQPQYWDLSMLRERRQSSPRGSSADSGFYESPIYGVDVNETFDDTNHVYAHEFMSPMFNGIPAESSAMAARRSQRSPASEEDTVAELQVLSPTKVGAEKSPNQHKRCYSANAIQLIESHLAAPSEKRRTSVGPAPERRI